VATISPFRGLRYDQSVVGGLATVTAPPYDVISPEQLDRFERASPYNVVRLILSRGTDGKDKYSQAAETLDRWISDGIFIRDEADALTVYEQRFTIGGHERVQRGLLAAVSLDGSVLPHEHTMRAPVSDRLALLRATRTQLSPVFAVYAVEDAGARETVARAIETEPLASWNSEDDGVAHRAWRIDSRDDIDAIERTMRDAAIVIADGHHRYRTAEEYAGERRAAEGAGPWDQMLLYLVDASWSGPALLPIHRALGVPARDVLAALAGTFEIEPAQDADPDVLAFEVEARRSSGRTFALLGRDAAWYLTVSDKAAEADALPAERSPVWRDLDVAVVEWFVMRTLLGGAEARYVHTPGEAAELLATGEAASALLLAPPPFDSVRAVAQAGEAMPPKSTFFIPKPRTGVVVRPLF
jgi:uncharacterized protein (DUF1015 family)